MGTYHVSLPTQVFTHVCPKVGFVLASQFSDPGDVGINLINGLGRVRLMHLHYGDGQKKAFGMSSRFQQ